MLCARAAAPGSLRRSAPSGTVFVLLLCARASASAVGARTDHAHDSQATVAEDLQATLAGDSQATVSDVAAEDSQATAAADSQTTVTDVSVTRFPLSRFLSLLQVGAGIVAITLPHNAPADAETCSDSIGI